jgi:hypothetical protein
MSTTGEEVVFAALRKKKELAASGDQADAEQTNWVAGLASSVDLRNNTSTIDGLQFSLLWTAGFLNLAKNVAHLNEINVFPVPDGDTGSNMKLGMMEGIKCLAADKFLGIEAAATSLAADTLMYGQGNSGSILSYFFGKLALEVKRVAAGRAQITVAEFAKVLEQVGPQMQGAALKPVEGTLLSTSRDCCIGMAKPSPPETLLELLKKWHEKAETELAKTPDQLVDSRGKMPLKDAGVVDSGAKGFVVMIEGMVLAATGELSFDDETVAACQAAGAPTDGDVELSADHDDLNVDTFPYCTEVLLKLKVPPGDTAEASFVRLQSALKAVEDDVGDSTVAVSAPAKTDGTLVKVHMHTADPPRLFKLLLGFSDTPVLLKEKVEDMRVQVAEKSAGYDMSAAKCVYVTDMSGQGPEWWNQYVHFIGAYLVVNDQRFDLLHTSPPQTNELFCQERLASATKARFQVQTAAPSKAYARLVLEKAIATADERGINDVLLVMVNDFKSAYHRVIAEAVKSMPQQQQHRIKVSGL